MKNKIITSMLVGILSCMILTSCKQAKTLETSQGAKDATTETSQETTDTNIATMDNTSITEEQNVQNGNVISELIDSKEIAKNIVGDNPKRKIFIYLPPSYESSSKRYPVVYYLQGYGDQSETIMQLLSDNLTTAFQSGSNEFIYVALDGNIKSGGSFYENSPVTGNWEDFVTLELVNYIDENYRTLPVPESRSISGYSMGGYGAINLGLKHPDVFSSIIAFCPGLYADGDFQSMWDSWNGWTDVKVSYAQAFSPSNNSEKNYGNIPEFTGTNEDLNVIKDWENGYGNWDTKIQDYLNLEIPLKGVQINYGNSDYFAWIPRGCKDFSDLLKSAGIEHQLNEINGGHVVPNGAIETYYLPFLEENLQY